VTSPRLLLDEMLPPALAEELRRRGHDVRAVAADGELRALRDDELFRLCSSDGPAELRGRRIVTENVKDFRPLLRSADEAGASTAGVLFTSSRRFPRSRRDPAPLLEALHAWLTGPDAAQRPIEDWLRAADT
jgi:hypothetical protein